MGLTCRWSERCGAVVKRLCVGVMVWAAVGSVIRSGVVNACRGEAAPETTSWDPTATTPVNNTIIN